MQQKLSISLSLSLSTPLLFFYFLNGIAYINIGIIMKSNRVVGQCRMKRNSIRLYIHRSVQQWDLRASCRGLRAYQMGLRACQECQRGTDVWTDVRTDGRTYGRTDGRTEFIPILQDFVP